MKTITYDDILNDFPDDFPEESGKFLVGWQYIQFWQKIVVGGEDACWLFKHPSTSGYGSVCYKGITYNASRLAYLDCNGPIPKGNVVRHTCNIRACCNPKHLITGTYWDNSADRVKAAVLERMQKKIK